MPVLEGSDYSLFPKVQVTKQSLTATMTDGVAVCTPNYIFVIPGNSIGALPGVMFKTTYCIDDPKQLVGRLAADAESLEAFESQLTEALSGDKTRWVFPLKDMEKFKMSTGFMGQTRMKMPGEKVRTLVFRGKGEKQRAKAFYDAVQN